MDAHSETRSFLHSYAVAYMERVVGGGGARTRAGSAHRGRRRAAQRRFVHDSGGTPARVGHAADARRGAGAKVFAMTCRAALRPSATLPSCPMFSECRGRCGSARSLSRLSTATRTCADTSDGCRRRMHRDAAHVSPRRTCMGCRRARRAGAASRSVSCRTRVPERMWRETAAWNCGRRVDCPLGSAARLQAPHGGVGSAALRRRCTIAAGVSGCATQPWAGFVWSGRHAAVAMPMNGPDALQRFDLRGISAAAFPRRPHDPPFIRSPSYGHRAGSHSAAAATSGRGCARANLARRAARTRRRRMA